MGQGRRAPRAGRWRNRAPPAALLCSALPAPAPGGGSPWPASGGQGSWRYQQYRTLRPAQTPAHPHPVSSASGETRVSASNMAHTALPLHFRIQRPPRPHRHPLHPAPESQPQLPDPTEVPNLQLGPPCGPVAGRQPSRGGGLTVFGSPLGGEEGWSRLYKDLGSSDSEGAASRLR